MKRFDLLGRETAQAHGVAQVPGNDHLGTAAGERLDAAFAPEVAHDARLARLVGKERPVEIERGGESSRPDGVQGALEGTGLLTLDGAGSIPERADHDRSVADTDTPGNSASRGRQGAFAG